jgi:hypothetical protein
MGINMATSDLVGDDDASRTAKHTPRRSVGGPSRPGLDDGANARLNVLFSPR